MFAGGHDVPADAKLAQQWFRAAAELGHGHAQLMLAKYLLIGADGGTVAEARLWLERAAAQGIADAEAELEALNPTMQPS